MSRRRPIADRRALLGHAAVYSVAEAAQLLPGGVAKVESWLRELRLVRPGPCGEVVVWGDVLDALETSRDGSLSSTVRPGGMSVRLAR